MSITDRVAAGAAALDEVRPGWREEIDVDLLDVASILDCPLGQLWGQYGAGHLALDDALHVDTYRNDWIIRHGFDPGDDSPREVTAAWRTEVSK